MNFGSIASEILVLYLKFLGVFMAYGLSREYARGTADKSKWVQIWTILQCLFGVAVVSILGASNNHPTADGEGRLHPRTLLVVFIALGIPAILGACDSMQGRHKRVPPPRSHFYDDPNIS